MGQRVGEPRHEALLQGVRAVLEGEREALGGAAGSRRLGDVDEQFEAGLAGAHHLDAGVGAGQVHFGARVVLEGEHDVGERLPAPGARRVQLAHHLVERHVLVGEGARSISRTRASSCRAVGPPAHVDAQDEHVHEEPDDVLDAAVPRAPGHGCADHEVLPRAGPREGGGERGEQGHEEGGALGAGGVHEAGVGGRVDTAHHGRGGGSRHGGPLGAAGQQRPVGVDSPQHLSPITDLACGERSGVGGGAEACRVAAGVLGVGDGQGRQRRCRLRVPDLAA